MNKSDRAEELFRMGYNCCQSVFGAFCDELGLELDEAMKKVGVFANFFETRNENIDLISKTIDFLK